MIKMNKTIDPNEAGPTIDVKAFKEVINKMTRHMPQTRRPTRAELLTSQHNTDLSIIGSYLIVIQSYVNHYGLKGSQKLNERVMLLLTKAIEKAEAK